MEYHNNNKKVKSTFNKFNKLYFFNDCFGLKQYKVKCSQFKNRIFYINDQNRIFTQQYWDFKI